MFESGLSGLTIFKRKKQVFFNSIIKIYTWSFKSELSESLAFLSQWIRISVEIHLVCYKNLVIDNRKDTVSEWNMVIQSIIKYPSKPSFETWRWSRDCHGDSSAWEQNKVPSDWEKCFFSTSSKMRPDWVDFLAFVFRKYEKGLHKGREQLNAVIRNKKHIS